MIILIKNHLNDLLSRKLNKKTYNGRQYSKYLCGDPRILKKEKDDIKKPNIHENRRIVKIITSFVASIISNYYTS